MLVLLHYTDSYQEHKKLFRLKKDFNLIIVKIASHYDKRFLFSASQKEEMSEN